MRTLTAAQENLLGLPDRTTHLRVEVEDSSSAWVDLADVQGYDWVRSATVAERTDDPVATAEIRLFRERDYLSLATLHEDSLLNQPGPLIDIARGVRVAEAVLPHGYWPRSADWIPIFEGRSDDVEWGGDAPQIVVPCRDLGGQLQDEWIKEQSTFTDLGLAETPQLMQDVIQAIITKWFSGSVTLYTPVAPSPAFYIRPYNLRKQPILQALRQIALLLGWDCRYRWDSGTSAWRLTLYGPDRSPASTMHTFGPSDYTELTRARISKMRIRNQVTVFYTKASDGLRYKLPEREDAASVARYDPLWSELAEGSLSGIDTEAEAIAFAVAFLADLSEPDLDHGVVMPPNPWAQLADYYEFLPNGIHYTTAQELAVSDIRHDFPERGPSTTAMGMRGKPHTGVDRWLELETRSGMAPTADWVAPATPDNVSVVAKDRGLFATFDRPEAADWDTVECHVFAHPTDASFDPDASTLKGETRTDRCKVDGLPWGTRHLVRLIAVDQYNNKSDASDAIDVFTLSKSFDTDEETGTSFDKGTIWNGQFNLATLGIANAAPDGHRVTGGDWKDDVYEDIVNEQSGDRAIEILSGSNSSVQFEGPLQVCAEDEYVVAEMFAKQAGGGAGMDYGFLWYTGALAANGSDTATAQNSVWARVSHTALAPANTRYYRLVFHKTTSAAYVVTLDHWTARRQSRDSILFDPYDHTGQLAASKELGAYMATSALHSYLQSAGSLALGVTTTASALTLDASHGLVLCSVAPGGSFTVTLPQCNTCGGRVYMIKKITSTPTLTVAANAADSIEGSASVNLVNNYSGLTIMSDGKNPGTWVLV